MTLVQIQSADHALLAQVDAAQSESIRRSGKWIVCRPGCTPCCHGPFAITQLDAVRLARGLSELPVAEAEAVVARARQTVARIANVYPGDAISGELFDEDALPDEFAGEPCPALDPRSGLCTVYAWRPLTCRTFGPAADTGEDTYGACELCYEGATLAEIAACAVDSDPDGQEAALLAALGDQGRRGLTIVAFALAGE